MIGIGLLYHNFADFVSQLVSQFLGPFFGDFGAMIRRLNTGMTTTSEIQAWIAQAQAQTIAQAIIIHPRPIRPHIYQPDQIDRLIELLNDELDDETKMKLVMMLPALQGHLKA